MDIGQLPGLVCVAEALSYGAAVAVSVVLFLLIIQTARSNSAMWLSAFCALLWSGASLISTLMILKGASPMGPGVWMARFGQILSGALFPISFLLLWPVPEPARCWRDRLRGWLLALASANAAAIVIMIAVSLSGNRRSFSHLHYTLHLVCSVCLMAAGAWISFQGRKRTLADHIYLVLTMVGMGTSVFVMFAVGGSKSMLQPTVLTVIEEQAPFLTLIGSLFYFARFRSADVLIKSGLKIMAGTALALVAAIAVTRSFDLGLQISLRAERVFLTAAVLMLLLFLYLAAARAVTFAVNRWILPRPDYRAALQELWTEVSSIDEEPAIFAALESHIQSLLEVRRAQVIAPAAGASIDEVQRRCSLADCEVEALAPIRVRGELAHVLAVAPGRRRSLLNVDIRFLEDAAALIGGRIEALLAERERSERAARETKLLQLAAEAELKALRAQINPHFLFNSLNTIADLIVTDPAKAETVTILLAKVFRHVLLYSDRQMTAVSEEIDFLRTYLRIEEVRFGARLSVRMDVDPQIAGARVPSLILQPVVENAIKHGLAPKIGPGCLNIRAGRQGSFVKLEVEDDGVGLSEAHLPPQGRRGVGLKIIAERLKTLYSVSATLTFESAATFGSRVTILIPLEAEIL